MKTFWKSMVSLSLAFAIFFSGFHMGGAGKAKVFTAVPEERVYDRDSTIAIVNLDEGGMDRAGAGVLCKKPDAVQ